MTSPAESFERSPSNVTHPGTIAESSVSRLSNQTIVTLSLVGAGVSWLAAWARPTLQMQDEAALTVLCLAVQSIGIGLRFAVDRTGNNHDWSNKITWICSYFALANALGFVAVAGPTSVGIIPSLLVTVVVESLVLSKMQPPFSQDRPNNSMQAALSTVYLEEEFDQCTRATFEELEEDGQRALRGWIRFEIEPGDKTTIVTIGFVPAFFSTPEMEVECEVDGEQVCDAHIEHLNPCAARLLLKRSNATGLLQGKLLWHAMVSKQSDRLHLLRSALP